MALLCSLVVVIIMVIAIISGGDYHVDGRHHRPYVVVIVCL